MTSEELCIKIQNGENTQDNALLLYQQNKGYIYSFVTKYSNANNLDDLMQEGFFACLDASMKYDSSKGGSFSTYLHFHLVNRIFKYLCNDKTVRIPGNLRSLIRKYKTYTNEYYLQYGCAPTTKETLDTLKITSRELELVKLWQTPTRSLNEIVYGDENESELMDFLPDDIDSLFDIMVDRAGAKQITNATLSKLPEKENYVIKALFFDCRTEKDIAEEMGVSCQYISLLKNQALTKMRSKCRHLLNMSEQADARMFRGNQSRFRHRQESIVEDVAISKLEYESEYDERIRFSF